MDASSSDFFTPGHWGFMEGWPRGADGPVFDICHGEDHVARVWRDRGAWKLVVRPSRQITGDLTELLQILAMIADRMRALETASAAADMVADGPFCLIDERGRTAQADMELMAELLFAGREPSAESAVKWGRTFPSAAPAE